MSTKPLTAWIEGIGFLAPGLPDWPMARSVLRDEMPLTAAPSVLPAPSILPPAERRRASRVVKLTLAIGLEAAPHAGANVATLATVLSASNWRLTTARFRRLASTIQSITPPPVTGVSRPERWRRVRCSAPTTAASAPG